MKSGASLLAKSDLPAGPMAASMRFKLVAINASKDPIYGNSRCAKTYEVLMKLHTQHCSLIGNSQGFLYHYNSARKTALKRMAKYAVMDHHQTLTIRDFSIDAGSMF
jgi:hypothetical protein